jgi:DNA helicase-2/ATP-dependent DNA helicase PcrA
MVHKKESHVLRILRNVHGMREFVEGQRVADARGSLSEFLEDVALATDLDNDTGDSDRVSLMTIHLSAGISACIS